MTLLNHPPYSSGTLQTVNHPIYAVVAVKITRKGKPITVYLPFEMTQAERAALYRFRRFDDWYAGLPLETRRQLKTWMDSDDPAVRQQAIDRAYAYVWEGVA